MSLFALLAALGAGCSVLPVSEDYTGAAANELTGETRGNVRECRWAKATGTKMRSRVCHTQDVWAQIDAATAPAQNTDDFFRRQREGATATGNVSVPDTTGGMGL